MPRFVLLLHDHPERHWDFMLEGETVLRTWRLPAVPQPDQHLLVQSSFDHRRLYLDYEGPVSGNRGTVQREDYGLFQWQMDTAEQIVVRLQGQRLHGELSLTRQHEGWLLCYHPLAASESTRGGQPDQDQKEHGDQN